MGKNKRWIQVAILAVVVIIGGWTMANSLFANNDKAPRAGDKAPDFKLAGLDGQTHRLSDYKGKTLVINFWGTYCPPCKAEMPAIQAAYDQFKGSDVLMLGVNMGESAVTARSFTDQVKAEFPILLDEDEAVRRRFGVTQYPTTFFIKPDGRISQVKIGAVDASFLNQTLNGMLGK